jgi:hypothetical protein
MEWLRNDLAHVPTDKTSSHSDSFLYGSRAFETHDFECCRVLRGSRMRGWNFRTRNREQPVMPIATQMKTCFQARTKRVSCNSEIGESQIPSTGPGTLSHLVCGAASGSSWSVINTDGVPESFQRFGAPIFELMSCHIPRPSS